MADRDRRMLKVIDSGMRHAEPLHQPPRAFVALGCERNNFPNAQALERKTQRDPRGFQRVTATPEPALEPPADLGAGCEWRFKLRDRQTGEPRELAFDLDCPKPPPTPLNISLHPLERR